MRLKVLLPLLLVFLLGLVCGAYLFHKSLPRSFLASGACAPHCYSKAEVAGLLTSVGLLRAPGLIPDVQMESDTCLAVRYPRPEARVHYVLFPKHDVHNIAELTPEDEPYVMGCFAMVHDLVARDHLRGYSLHTNGPQKQEIAYLHFHLLAP